MKILYLCFFLILYRSVLAQPVDDFASKYDTVSVYYSVPDNNDKPNYSDVNFRFGWTNKAPYVVAIQFVNHSYTDAKFKFAIKDTTSKTMVVIDADHNASFSMASVKANSTSDVWSGPIDDPKDSFSVEVWDADGNEYDKVPISVADQQ